MIVFNSKNDHKLIKVENSNHVYNLQLHIYITANKYITDNNLKVMTKGR